jgi:phosphatidylserine/phosphatidylglycerophosphate/cardiolipin synthase-like enzyme
MSFEPSESHIYRLVHELIAAAKRGVHVYLLVDAISFSTDQYELPIGPTLLLHKAASSRRPYFRQKYLLLEELRDSGGHYHIINFPKRRLANPYAGRSHIKIAVVDNWVFTGGCNLGSEQIDYMTCLEDSTVADWLYELVIRVTKDGNVGHVLDYQDHEFNIDDKTTLLVDAGKPKQSLIYESALECIDAAQEWLVMTCQFFPNTVTAEHLAAAVRRGVNVTLYYNHPRHHAMHMRPVHRAVVWMEKTRQPHTLFAHQLPKSLQRLHAKLIASEQGAMIGSHNYVTHGVNFGTAEIAIRRQDPAFAREALDVLKQYLPPEYAASLRH